MALGFACNSSTAISGDSPTEAYKRLYSAVKSKDTDAIKKQLTKKSVDFGLMVSQRNNSPIDKVYENGFTATTFAETLPTIRDERVSGDFGAAEVWNSKESKWEDLNFIKEDGVWKFAVGDVWANTYKSPGKGRDQRDFRGRHRTLHAGGFRRFRGGSVASGCGEGRRFIDGAAGPRHPF